MVAVLKIEGNESLPAVLKARSLAEALASLPARERAQVLGAVPAKRLREFLYDWRGFWARREQLLPDGVWETFLQLTGRGWGKTRSGAEGVREMVERGEWRRVALVGRTAADVRDVMVEGESGILAVSPPHLRPIYEPTRRELSWPMLPGHPIAKCYAAKEPDQLRGPSHDGAWADEVASWQYRAAWDNLQFGLRIGSHPRTIATTTPKPVQVIRDLLKDSGTIVVRGRTGDNEANLAASFIRTVVRRYEGTRIGLQELEGQLLEDVPGALWTRKVLEDTRVQAAPGLKRIAVAIDPSGSAEEDAAEAGIVAGGLGVDGEGYVLDDATLRGTPDQWGKQAVATLARVGADRIIAEVNFGGDMVEFVIRTVSRKVPVKKVRASRGKQVRAEPVAALYEQGRIHHVGYFAELEDECCSWVPGEKSPNRMDALVWLMTDLFDLDRESKTYGVHYQIA